jgi:hypothetical protein
MTQIQPFALWLGHAGDGRNVTQLLESGIVSVVQLAAEEADLQLPREIVYCHIPLLDGAGNDPKVLALAVRTVAQCCSLGLPTLVCCGGGMSRSPAITAAALAAIHKEPAEKWLKHVTQSHHSDVSPGLWNEAIRLAAQS